MVEKEYIAIIPARGGSKGLPRKNVLNLFGKPLIAHTITAALNSKRFSRVIVSTDCTDIKTISQEWGAEVFDRPPELATDSSSSIDVLAHALELLKSKKQHTSHFVLLQPTSPLRNSNHITEAVDQINTGNHRTLISVLELEDTPFKSLYQDENGEIKPMRYWSDLTAARQILPKAFKPNGAIYIAETAAFLNDRELINKDTSIYKMSPEYSTDIDTIDDLKSAEKYLQLGTTR